MRAGGCLGMILDGEYGLALVLDALGGLVVQVDMGHFNL